MPSLVGHELDAQFQQQLEDAVEANDRARTFHEALLADAENAKQHPLFGRMRLRDGVVMIVKPRIDMREIQTSTGLRLPTTARMREWMVESVVLRTGPGCEPALRPGTHIFLPFYSGHPVFDNTAGCETLVWLISDGDIAVVVEHDDA